MDEAWRFGPYILSTSRRRLERDGSEVSLGARSFDILATLVQRAGEVISKAELMAAVWGDIVVDDSSVRVHVSMLRKALAVPAPYGSEWIANIPLRGYMFCGTVERLAAAPMREPDAPAPVARLPLRGVPGLSPRGERLVGRDDEVVRLAAMLDHDSLLTLVGPGGIGKTALAVAVARHWAAAQRGSAVFVDLAPAHGATEVLGAIGAAVGVGADLNGTVDSLRSRLAQRPTLLLLDNCEHVLEVLAPLVDALWDGTEGLYILATSREALRLPGEAVHRLGVLAVPEPPVPTALAGVLRFPAVELFVMRATAAGAAPFDDSHAGLLAAICHQLDGIPLALELVAARLSVMTLSDLAARLDEHMQLRSVGGRTVLARHQTMAATLDWSLALLDENELRLLRRLAVFCGRFDLESALRMAGEDIDADTAFQALSGLVAKSLLSLDTHTPAAPYRLLTVTRSYAGSLLDDCGERLSAQRCHAVWVHDLMSASRADLPAMSSAQWDARYGHLLPDVRVALDWAHVHEPALAYDLTITSAALWFHGSYLAEYRERLLRALAAHPSSAHGHVVTQLRLALGNAMWHTQATTEQMLALFEQALRNCDAADLALQMHARWGVCIALVTAGRHQEALAQAATLAELAEHHSDAVMRQLALRVIALTSHFGGHFAQARVAALRAIATLPGRRPARVMLQVDGAVAVNAFLARTLWIEGRQRAAYEVCLRTLNDAQASSHALSLCFALFGVCPVFLWGGDDARARTHIDLMLEETERRDLQYWHAWARCFDAALSLRQYDAGVARIAAAEAARGMWLPRREMMATCRLGYLDDELLRRAQCEEGGWADAEVLRCAGEEACANGRQDDGIALLEQALGRAHAQGAYAWAVRSAVSLACPLVQEGRDEEAADALAGACAMLVQGEESGEALYARDLLLQLRGRQPLLPSPRQQRLR